MKYYLDNCGQNAKNIRVGDERQGVSKTLRRYLNLDIETHLKKYMGQAFNTKVVISGNYVELTTYENPIFVGYPKKMNRKKKKKIISPKEKEENKKRSKRRTRTEFRRLVNCNEQLNKFLTLTFDPKKHPNTTQVSYSNSLFNKFIMRMKYRFKEFQYIAVPEYQKDYDFHGNPKPGGGNIHYHLLCKLDKYIPIKKLCKAWKEMGSVKINRINRINNISIYMSKYLGKNIDDERFNNKKKYFKSQNLNTPIQHIDILAHHYMNTNDYQLEFDFENNYHNKYIGNINHKFYKIIQK